VGRPGPSPLVWVGRTLAHTHGHVIWAGRQGFPSTCPCVCVTLLSCGRLHLLRKTLTALMDHMEQHEPLHRCPASPSTGAPRCFSLDGYGRR
jgi:hypothetical protein